MAKDTFVFYREWLPIIDTLPDTSRLKFYDIVCKYDGGEFPKSGDPHLDGVMQFVLSKVVENNKKYSEKCEKATLAAKMRWHANACERIDSHTNAMLNDNDNVYVNDNVLTTPKPPSSAGAEEGKGKKSRKPPRVETTLEKAKSHYKTEIETAKSSSAAAADIEGFRSIALEICGLQPTTECPNGMVRTVMRLPEQLTFKQYMNLLNEWKSFAVIRNTLLEIHNTYEQYHSKRESVNLVMRGWNRKSFAKQSSNGQLPPNVASTPKEVRQ